MSIVHSPNWLFLRMNNKCPLDSEVESKVQMDSSEGWDYCSYCDNKVLWGDSLDCFHDNHPEDRLDIVICDDCVIFCVSCGHPHCREPECGVPLEVNHKCTPKCLHCCSTCLPEWHTHGLFEAIQDAVSGLDATGRLGQAVSMGRQPKLVRQNAISGVQNEDSNKRQKLSSEFSVVVVN